MKKILHISKYYYPFRGGTEQIAQDCANALKDIYDQKIICFNHEKGNKIDLIDDIEVIRCGCFAKVSSQSLSISYSKYLKKAFNEYKPDIVIFHYPNPFVATLLLKYIPKGTKLVVYWHLDIVKQKVLGKLFINQNKKLINRAERLIATSPNYIDGSPYLRTAREKCKVIPNCINTERLQETRESSRISSDLLKKHGNCIICLAVGRHTEYKGFKYLIRASKLLDDRFKIFITGKGEETNSLLKEAHNDNKVHFLGIISDDELKAYYKVMDILCFPSITKNEAFGLALAEGLYYEKPAVTFHIPGSGVNYVCIDGEGGIEVPNKDVTEYANALKKLADNPDLRKKMGSNGKKRVEDNFLTKQFSQNIKNVINELYK